MKPSIHTCRRGHLVAAIVANTTSSIFYTGIVHLRMYVIVLVSTDPPHECTILPIYTLTCGIFQSCDMKLYDHVLV